MVGLRAVPLQCHSRTATVVDVASTSVPPCGDSGNIVATAIKGHKAKLNAEPVAALPAVRRRLREVLSYRAEKLVYVRAESDVPWSEFIELVDNVWPETDVVSILTPQVEAQAGRTYCLQPSCRDCTGLGGFRSRSR